MQNISESQQKHYRFPKFIGRYNFHVIAFMNLYVIEAFMIL